MAYADTVSHLLRVMPHQLGQNAVKVLAPAARDAINTADRMSKDLRQASASAAKYVLDQTKKFTAVSNSDQPSAIAQYANAAKQGLSKVGTGTVNLSKRACFWRKGVE